MNPSAIWESMKDVPEDAKIATFAGGCFWCMEPAFENIEGVYRVIPGYTGGEEERPDYTDVASGKTGHREAVQVYYDPRETDYADLLEVFWSQIDATDAGGQFQDRGHQYSTAIFYHDEEQRQKASESKEALEQRSEEPVMTEILQAGEFYAAERYHQGFAKKHPLRYRMYRKGREAWK